MIGTWKINAAILVAQAALFGLVYILSGNFFLATVLAGVYSFFVFLFGVGVLTHTNSAVDARKAFALIIAGLGTAGTVVLIVLIKMMPDSIFIHVSVLVILLIVVLFTPTLPASEDPGDGSTFWQRYTLYVPLGVSTFVGGVMIGLPILARRLRRLQS